jgi:hypothetical protein
MTRLNVDGARYEGIMGGAGAGLVNPPLASTAVGVVPPQQAGMASGINSTVRQVGTATGIALPGTLLSNDVKDEVLTRTAAVSGLSARGPEIAGAVQSGQIGNVIARLPAPARQVVGTITRAAFTAGLDRILLVAAIIAFVAGAYRWPLSAAGTLRAPRPAVRKPQEMRGPGRAPVSARDRLVAAQPSVRTGAGHTRNGDLSEHHRNRAAGQARAALGPGDRAGSLPGRYDVLGLLRG